MPSVPWQWQCTKGDKGSGKGNGMSTASGASPPRLQMASSCASSTTSKSVVTIRTASSPTFAAVVLGDIPFSSAASRRRRRARRLLRAELLPAARSLLQACCCLKGGEVVAQHAVGKRKGADAEVHDAPESEDQLWSNISTSACEDGDFDGLL